MPRTEKGRRTRERIVEEATALMVERGVRATGLDDVRAAAGVSKSQLYHYFADKRDLVQAVVEQTIGIVLDSQPRLADLASWDAIDGWMDDLVELTVERGGRGGCPLGGFVAELADHDPDARAQLAAGYEGWQRKLADGLTTMQERGALRADADPARLAATVMAALQGGLKLTQVHQDPERLRDALEMARAHLHRFAV